MFTIDMHEGSAAHVGHTGTAIDLVQVTRPYGDARANRHVTLITATIDVTAYRYLALCQQD